MSAQDPILLEAEKIISIWKLGGLTSRELARRVWVDIYAGDLLTRAAALSYYFLFALFPMLLFLISLLGFFAESGTTLRKQLLTYLSKIMPRSASTLIYTTVDEISANAGSVKLSLGLLITLWVASSGVAALGDTLNVSYGVKESRSWWRVRLAAIGLTIMLAFLIVIGLSLIIYGGEMGVKLADYFNQGPLFTMLWNMVQILFVLAFVLFTFAVIYYFTPNLYDQQWYWITPGSIIGVALWLLVSFLLRIYLHFFNSYSFTYGSLGAVIILMLWFYITGTAILLGGKINAEIEGAAAKAGIPGAKNHGEKVASDESVS